MEKLPPEIIFIIMAKLDPVSFIRFYETGWKGVLHPFFRIQYDNCHNEYRSKNAMFSILTGFARFAEIFGPGVGLQLEGFEDAFQQMRPSYEKILQELYEKYKKK